MFGVGELAGVFDVVLGASLCVGGFAFYVSARLQKFKRVLQGHGFAVGGASAGIRNGRRLDAGDIPFEAREINVDIAAGTECGDTADERFEIGASVLQVGVFGEHAVGLELAGEFLLEVFVRSELVVCGFRAPEKLGGIVAGRTVPGRV